MAKVLFIAKYPLDRPYSVMQKLDGQILALKNMGHDVSRVSFDRNNVYLEKDGSRTVVKKTILGSTGIYYHLLVFRDIYSAARRELKSQHYDLVYFRYNPLNFSGVRMLKTAHMGSDVVVEIPTYPPDKETQKSALRRAYMKYSDYLWKKAARYVTLFALIGEKAGSCLGVPSINIDNGVCIESIPLRNKTEAKDGKIHLVAVAAMSKWHGYDRIICGLRDWANPKKSGYIIDMVGDEGDGSLSEWKKLAEESVLSDQVVFHGQKTGDPLTAIYENAAAGIGSLGMYRNNINRASILKLREYMARGVPFIYAHDDPDVDEDMPWCCRFTNDDTPIDMDRVDEFIESLGNHKDLGKRMREYASEHMSWEVQFRKVFTKIKELTGKDY